MNPKAKIEAIPIHATEVLGCDLVFVVLSRDHRSSSSSPSLMMIIAGISREVVGSEGKPVVGGDDEFYGLREAASVAQHDQLTLEFSTAVPDVDTTARPSKSDHRLRMRNPPGLDAKGRR